MNEDRANQAPLRDVDPVRRKLVAASGAMLAASALGTLSGGLASVSRAQAPAPVRWGFVGTGSIANAMAAVVRLAPAAELAAVSSRRMESARAFAEEHGAGRAFDSWAEMAAWDGIDAVYVATPTSVREEICVAAADRGKHVLGEKPFASLHSLQNITGACRRNRVAFMDGTHFVHHPRTAHIRNITADRIGRPRAVDSAFQFPLSDRSNIRYNPDLEPLGAIGDAGWYNMRAAVEYLFPDAALESASAYLRRDPATGAVIAGSGVLQFDDGATSAWSCGFDAGAVVMDLRITGEGGVINCDDFLSQARDHAGSYRYRQGDWGPGAVDETIRVESVLPGAALMFEEFAAQVQDPSLRERWMTASERTQHLLDAAWYAALATENPDGTAAG